MQSQPSQRVRFGPFELDPSSRELTSGTGSIRLQEQSCAILELLVARRGQVVTRDELRRRLWPDGTFVDFEHSLNAAIKRLRAVLGDDADNPRFIETIPRRGYRLMAEADEPEARDSLTPGPRIRLAVLPFSDLGTPADDYFSHGFTDEMISELGRRGRGALGVISSHSSRAFKDTPARAREIGAALRADYLLEGSIRRDGRRVRITARLVETSTETQLWVETYEQPLTDWLDAQAEIATRIAGSLAMELLPRRAAAGTTSTSEAARHAFLKGRYHYQRVADSGAREAHHFFSEAAALDPAFGAAYAGLALVEIMRANYYHDVPRPALERARESTQRAIRLAPDCAESYVAEGEVRRALLWDLPGARSSYTRAVSLNPTLETARVAHARLLVSLGRFAQAIHEAELGRELDPRCLTANSVAAWARYAAGDLDAAIDLCRHTLEMDEAHVGARQLLGGALVASGSRKEAIRVLEWQLDADRQSPVLVSALAHARAAAGDHAVAQSLVGRLEQERSRRYVSPFALAMAYAGLANGDAAFDALERACEDRDPAILNLAVEPRLAPLRGDPRYAPLLRRLGLDEFHRD